MDNALEMLKVHKPSFVAHELGVKYETLRKALGRRGIKLSDYAPKPKGRTAPRRAFIAPSENPERAFHAMAAFENDPGGCRYPIGDLDKGNFRFCGREANNKTYCPSHHEATHIAGSAHWSAEQYADWILAELEKSH